MSKSTFGYGSLILPTSVVARFNEEVGSAQPLYDRNLELGDEDLLREEAVKAWEKAKEEDTLEFVPVKIEGFRRNYTWEKYGQTMLEARPTGNSEDIINGVVIRGLNEDQYKAIASSEDGYGVETVEAKEIEPYIDDVEIEEDVTIYVEGDDERSNFFTDRTRGNTYHSRILKGIEMMAEVHGEEVAEQFRKDFERNTYENSIPGNSFSEETPEQHKYELRNEFMNTVEQQNRAEEGFAQLMDGIEEDYKEG